MYTCKCYSDYLYAGGNTRDHKCVCACKVMYTSRQASTSLRPAPVSSLWGHPPWYQRGQAGAVWLHSQSSPAATWSMPAFACEDSECSNHNCTYSIIVDFYNQYLIELAKERVYVTVHCFTVGSPAWWAPATMYAVDNEHSLRCTCTSHSIKTLISLFLLNYWKLWINGSSWKVKNRNSESLNHCVHVL